MNAFTEHIQYSELYIACQLKFFNRHCVLVTKLLRTNVQSFQVSGNYDHPRYGIRNLEIILTYFVVVNLCS